MPVYILALLVLLLTDVRSRTLVLFSWPVYLYGAIYTTCSNHRTNYDGWECMGFSVHVQQQYDPESLVLGITVTWSMITAVPVILMMDGKPSGIMRRCSEIAVLLIDLPPLMPRAGVEVMSWRKRQPRNFLGKVSE